MMRSIAAMRPSATVKPTTAAGRPAGPRKRPAAPLTIAEVSGGENEDPPAADKTLALVDHTLDFARAGLDVLTRPRHPSGS